MDSNITIEWVIQNRKKILSHVYRNGYFDLAPYGHEEYMQEAFIAALKAYRDHQSTSTTAFARKFWINFKDAIVGFVPKPRKRNMKLRVRNNESMSIPSSDCISDDVLLFTSQKTDKNKADYGAFLFTWIRPALTKQESMVLYLSRGFGSEGFLSEREISKQLKISRARVQELLKSSIDKAVSLIEEKDSTNKNLMKMFTVLKDLHHTSKTKGD